MVNVVFWPTSKPVNKCVVLMLDVFFCIIIKPCKFAKMLLWPHLLTHLLALNLAWAVLTPPPQGYDDDITPLPLRLEDLEREQEQFQVDLNRPPLLPNRYEWRPNVAASVPPSYIQDAAQREIAREREKLEQLHQLQQQHKQLSAGYAFPGQLPANLFFVTPTAATITSTATIPKEIASTVSTRLLKPIVPYDLDLQLNGIQYLTGNALTSLPSPGPPPPPPPPSLRPRPVRPPYIYAQSPATSSLYQQSKQFAYAPPAQRNYAPSPRIPLPYPPSFISITTRRPGPGRGNFGYSHYQKPFRPSQPDPTPDLFAGRESKSLLDSYIPSWEVLRILQQHQLPSSLSSASSLSPSPSHTLAYPINNLRLFKRMSAREANDSSGRIVKKSLTQSLDKTPNNST
ncbi:uncharacterized protein [Drosophila tropicalis]|uniref:uncharacterized protein n=1 Tax=Drosophila tropicalis TaxID=46794 RepID=UPI0035ABFA76